MTDIRRWLADELVRRAVERMRQRRPDWAQAMMNEHHSLSGDEDQLGWAAGSFRASLSLADLFYPVVLALGVAAMTLYQWSADESLITVMVLGLLGGTLGLVRPRLFLVSGLALGPVVAAVNGFETLSGVRPAYEAYNHSWAHDFRWLVLILPALVSSALGRWVGLKLFAPTERRT